REVDQWFVGVSWPTVRRGHHVEALLLHVVQHPTDVLGDQLTLQSPRRVGVADTEREVGHTVEHGAAIHQRSGWIERLAVDRHRGAAEYLQMEPGGRDHDIALQRVA